MKRSVRGWGIVLVVFVVSDVADCSCAKSSWRKTVGSVLPLYDLNVVRYDEIKGRRWVYV